MEIQKDTKQGGKHALFMILCCLVPLLLVLLLFTVGIGGILPFLVILLCPLMHLFMMRGYGGHDHQHAPPHTAAELPEQTETAKSATVRSDMADGQKRP